MCVCTRSGARSRVARTTAAASRGETSRPQRRAARDAAVVEGAVEALGVAARVEREEACVDASRSRSAGSSASRCCSAPPIALHLDQRGGPSPRPGSARRARSTSSTMRSTENRSRIRRAPSRAERRAQRRRRRAAARCRRRAPRRRRRARAAPSRRRRRRVRVPPASVATTGTPAGERLDRDDRRAFVRRREQEARRTRRTTSPGRRRSREAARGRRRRGSPASARPRHGARRRPRARARCRRTPAATRTRSSGRLIAVSRPAQPITNVVSSTPSSARCARARARATADARVEIEAVRDDGELVRAARRECGRGRRAPPR